MRGVCRRQCWQGVSSGRLDRGDDGRSGRARARPAGHAEGGLRGRQARVPRGGQGLRLPPARRKDAVDPETGERLDDVLMFRVPDLEVKELLLSDDRGIYFTTPHFDGYAAVLVRIPDLERLDREELGDVLADGVADAGQEVGRESVAGPAGRRRTSGGASRWRPSAARALLLPLVGPRWRDAAAPAVVAKPIAFPAKREARDAGVREAPLRDRHLAAGRPEGDRRAHHRLEHVRLGVPTFAADTPDSELHESPGPAPISSSTPTARSTSWCR